MNQPIAKIINGKLIQGHQVASGTSPTSPYPQGTIANQIPFFRQLGLDLSPYFQGTLNIDIAPYACKVNNPQLTFAQVNWTQLHPPEDFSFSPCQVLYNDGIYDGWVYYPHPETKIRHFHNPSVMELIAVTIPNIKYRDLLQIEINPLEIEIIESNA
ncbi:MAG: hypothetical protein IM537_18300 [Pseudanabaena sp. M57BS1SP1A06MG]|nr:hypothetical protein [Pseudanabaena sp. M53BS1SP1A06MG]MCA6592811.1 hypothetical protein [Pseudanabaena sp. M38BS1SP1A06MG]MCA6602102.1 hypothetical protein [Pseudanabaena sp. M57BS1SP1A06MG]